MEYALITGATSGIGYALAECFAKDGVGLVLVSSSLEHLRQTKEKMEQNPAENVERSIFVFADFTNHSVFPDIQGLAYY